MCVGGGSKAKALQACSVELVLLLRDGPEQAIKLKKIVYLRKQIELNQVGIYM